MVRFARLSEVGCVDPADGRGAGEAIRQREKSLGMSDVCTVAIVARGAHE
jgi:hypothetical protein